MDKTVPGPAAYLLDFIGSIEAPNGYDTLFGNAQKRYSWRLTNMDLAYILRNGPTWGRKRSQGGHGSSACGRYQFMAGKNHTLQGLANELKLRGGQIFDANLQDRLGYHLLRRRGYDKWIVGKITDDQFMLELAKEWASFPRPDNGRSYYAGDGLNHALVSRDKVRAALRTAKSRITRPEYVPTVQPEPEPPVDKAPDKVRDDPPVPADLVASVWAWVFRGFKRA